MKRLLWDDKLRMPSAFGCIIGILAFVAVAVAIGLTTAITIHSRNCAYASRQFHRSTHYDWLAGCYVSIGNGQRIPLDQYRAIQGTR